FADHEVAAAGGDRRSTAAARSLGARAAEPQQLERPTDALVGQRLRVPIESSRQFAATKNDRAAVSPQRAYGAGRRLFSCIVAALVAQCELHYLGFDLSRTIRIDVT
ncbi:MAG: hypothetical protein QF473_40990, partial [Planctomycetota bacterium]|nr:hypothetical protein [Planctomycetota bacterium]